MNNKLNENLWYYIKGSIIGIFVTFAFMAVFAAVILFAEIDRAFAEPFATVCVALGAIVASFYAAYKIGDKGYKVGLIIGLIFFVAVTLISLLISYSLPTANTVFHFVIIIIASLVGGIIGVNRKSRKKYI